MAVSGLIFPEIPLAIAALKGHKKARRGPAGFVVLVIGRH